MKKRNIPIIILIILGFILIVIACSRRQAQELTANQAVAQVEQPAWAADRPANEQATDLPVRRQTGEDAEAEHEEAEAEHQDEAEHEETEDAHADDHGPEEHIAGNHGVPDEAAAVENPVPATDESVAAGAAIYAQNCAVCHGETGEGDGPAAAGLEKEPADLHADHVQANSDGALFWIITHGRPESPMPPWDNVLTEEQRWQVVNFLRTFGDGDTVEQGEAVEEHGHAAEVEEGHHH